MISAYEQGGLDGMAELSQSSFGDLPDDEAMTEIRAALRQMTNPRPDDAPLTAPGT